MKETEIRDIMAGGGGRRGVLLRPWLWLASRSYGDIMAWRRWNYRIGLLKSVKADVPVICVGNITTGGTGKTPMVAWVVAQLAAAGAAPAIVTRGYKARDGKSDEAEMLCCLCDCPVVVNANRVAGAQTAIVAGANVVVLDDGYQHRRLKRDLDIVLIDAINPFGYGHVLPRGLLRERPAALKDAHAVVITRSDQITPDQLAELRGTLKEYAPGASMHVAAHRPVGLLNEKSERLDLTELTGKRAVAFCGLGNPRGFFGTVRQVGADVAAEIAYNDHAVYDDTTVRQIDELADSADADVLVTTQKDAVKLAGLNFQKPLRQLMIEMDILEGRYELVAKIANLAPQEVEPAEDDQGESAGL